MLRYVPSSIRQAWRNVSGTPAVALIMTIKKLGQFFLEVGRPVTGSPLPMTSEDLEHFAAVSARYGYLTVGRRTLSLMSNLTTV
jgi:hypothetical protein